MTSSSGIIIMGWKISRVWLVEVDNRLHSHTHTLVKHLATEETI